jgi:N-acetylglucosaminyldiphosphoundecaprenol N-acetyl-beta-D-mannosaminyltransferase
MVMTSSAEAMMTGRWRQERDLPRHFHGGFSRRAAKPPKVTVGDVPIDRLSMNDAVQWIVECLWKRSAMSPLLIMASNAQLVTLSAANRSFGRAIRSAHLNVPDGISVVLASRLLGCPIPERVPGGDLMERLCAESARHGFSVFFLGGLPGAAIMAALRLKCRYPTLRVAGCYCPDRGFENDPAESATVRRLIADAAPDLLCVALGAPKQEIWMHENCSTLPIGAAICVGAALDTTAGLRSRAPRWTHKLGMEWLYRLIREPRRLGRRYLVGNTQFLALVARQLAQQMVALHPLMIHPPLTIHPLAREPLRDRR